MKKSIKFWGIRENEGIMSIFINRTSPVIRNAAFSVIR